MEDSRPDRGGRRREEAGVVEPLHGPQASRLGRIPQRSALAFSADILASLAVPSRTWHVDGLIPGRTVTLLGGDGGVGKSTLVLQLCCATAADGLEWIGLRTRPGRALFLSCEDDRDELHRRLQRIGLHHGLGLEAFAALKLWPLADQDALLVRGEPGRPLEPTDLWSEFRDLVADWRPNLIVIDSLADVFGGNENDRSHARAFVRLLRGLALDHDAAVLLLMHPSLTGLSSGSGMSGSTAWNNSVRSRLYLAPPPTDGIAPAVDIRLLQTKKTNYGPAAADLRLRYQSGAFVLDNPSSSNPLDLAIAADQVDALFLALLDAFDASGRIISDSTGRNYAPYLFARDPRASGTTRKTFEAAMSRLFAASSIRVAEVGRGSHLRRKIVREKP